MASVIIHRSTDIYPPTDWHLSFQLVTYDYGEGQDPEPGYRFIWKRPGGALQAARGQARLPSYGEVLKLSAKAASEGWLFNTEEEVVAYVAGLTGKVPPPGVAAYLAGSRHAGGPGQADLPAAS